MGYLLLFTALGLNAIANLLLKQGADRLTPLGEPGSIQALLANYHLFGGLILFALNVVFYVGALARLNLAVAYPIMMAGGVLIVFSASVLLLKEPFNAPQLIGTALLIAGIILITARGTA